MNTPIRFIFFGRLVKEKGFDFLISVLEKLSEDPNFSKAQFFIFGNGELKNELFHAFSSQHYFLNASNESVGNIEAYWDKRIIFFGWKDKTSIESVLSHVNYALMPSRFLETFGLSALEAMKMGVPVIGFKKGGLESLLRDEEGIEWNEDDVANAEKLYERITEIIESFSDENYKEDARQVRSIAEEYNKEKWLTHFRELIPVNAKKILLVSDYLSPLGGIETYIRSVGRLLTEEGYDVQLFGLPESVKVTRMRKIWNLFLTGFNFWSLLRYKKIQREFRPDVIFCHSVSRYLGPYVVREIGKQKNITSMIMYHDFGLFSPYPSSLTSIEDLPRKFSLASFLAASPKKFILSYLALCFKYIQLRFFRTYLTRIDIHLVPSSFMEDPLERLYNIPKDRIKTLPHFIDS